MSGYRTIYIPDHPLWPPGSTAGIGEHRIVLYDKIGPGTHSCHWCGAVVAWTVGTMRKRGMLMPDHLDGDKRNNVPENLVPTCHSCNIHRTPHRDAIRDDEPTVIVGDAPTRAQEVHCEHCQRPFLVRLHDVRSATKGRFCSQSCRASGMPSARQGKALKLPAEQIPELLAALASGMAQTAVGELFGVSRRLVGMIASGKRRKQG